MSSLNPCSGNGGYAASRNNPQQSSLNSDLLRQSQEQQQHGGPILDFAIAFLSKILPCSEALLGRLLWVTLWSWKAAPVALYESLFARNNSKSTIETSDNTNQDNISSQRGGWLDSFKNSNPTGDVSQYFQKWWQKTFVIPTAMGFYYFMYDYVSEPILESVGCCSSEALTTTLGVGMLVVHFLSGVAMHLWQKRKNTSKAAVLNDAVALEGDAQQPSQSSPSRAVATTLDNNQDAKDWVTMEKAHANATEAITDYQAVHNTTSGNDQLPSAQALFNAVKEKKKKFWPFGGKKKTSNKFNSNAPPTTELV